MLRKEEILERTSNGLAVFKPATVGDRATGFQVQNAAGNHFNGELRRRGDWFSLLRPPLEDLVQVDTLTNLDLAANC